MKKPKKSKFLKKPEYPGGSKAISKFINENIQYPEQAKKNNIEGFVVVEFKVNDLGNVFDAKILKGLGYGLDEEAIRLVNSIKFQKARNPGFRVTVTRKIKINFKIRGNQITMVYHYKEKIKEEEHHNKGESYNYIINI